MRTMTKPKKKKGKAGRPAERLIITGDPQAALRELLKPKPKKKPKR